MARPLFIKKNNDEKNNKDRVHGGDSPTDDGV